ncbi:MAG: thiolase domain-containing protein [candidate division WOR-3 bacterium]
MSERVAIIGIGATQFRSISSDVSYKELMFEAAVKAYEDCGINPRKDVDTFVTCAEDYIEGTSIFDEYVPDQLGAALKPMHTIAGDGLHGLATTFLQIKTGQFDVAVVEAHCKPSNMLSPDGIEACAQDPIFNRPLKLNTHFIAGLEMNRFCYETGITFEQCAKVVIKNRKNALNNPIAGRAAKLSLDDFKYADGVACPLTELDIAQPVDGAVVVVLASEKKAKAIVKNPIWIKGIGWCNGTPSLESRDWVYPEYVTKAAEMAYQMAAISDPTKDLCFAEIDDRYSYKELQHMMALKLTCECGAGQYIDNGVTEINGKFPVNPSGGALGMGYLYEATGLARLYCAVEQLRGNAGKNQIKGAKTALVQSWRGLPTTSAVVVILSNEGGING